MAGCRFSAFLRDYGLPASRIRGYRVTCRNGIEAHEQDIASRSRYRHCANPRQCQVGGRTAADDRRRRHGRLHRLHGFSQRLRSRFSSAFDCRFEVRRPLPSHAILYLFSGFVWKIRRLTFALASGELYLNFNSSSRILTPIERSIAVFCGDGAMSAARGNRDSEKLSKV